MNEFFAGCANGFIQSLVGHPIDTLKVLQQTKQPLHRNFLHYYKGISYPMSFNFLCTGTTFNIHAKYNTLLGCHYKSGFLTGLTISPIVYYFDMGKIHYQLNPTNKIDFSKCRITNGMGATLGREALATSVYMGVYFNNYEEYGALVAGGAAGLLSWTISYPLDVIKTRQMNNSKINIIESIAIGNLWRGYYACAFRAIVVNAIGFWVYDALSA